MAGEDEDGQLIDFSAQKSLGSCPKCGGSVFEHGQDFVCDKSVVTVEDATEICDFSLKQTLFRQPISREQLSKLLESGKTDLLEGFVSFRTKRPFQARLVWDEAESKVKFETPEIEKAPDSQSVMVPNSRELAKIEKRKLLDLMPDYLLQFNSTYQSASAELLEEVFKLHKSSVEFSGASVIPTSLVGAIHTVDQSIFCKFLAREDCPDWLGVWIAKHGGKEHQCAYLFRPNIEVELDIADRIASRPPAIKQLFWASKSSVVVNKLLDSDDEMYLAWARDIGFDRDIQVESIKLEDGSDYVPLMRGQVDDWIENVLDPVPDALWKKHVPKEGACTVLQGELVRCIGRLKHEYWSNWMGNMGGAFYDRMVDMIKETVLSKNSFSPLVRKVLVMDASVVKGTRYGQSGNVRLFQDSNVEISLKRLENVVAAWCLKNPEPIPYIPNALD